MKTQPPTFIWVSYCTRCGSPICADEKKEKTSCHLCPMTKNGGPRVAFKAYMACSPKIMKRHP